MTSVLWQINRCFLSSWLCRDVAIANVSTGTPWAGSDWCKGHYEGGEVEDPSRDERVKRPRGQRKWTDTEWVQARSRAGAGLGAKAVPGQRAIQVHRCLWNSQKEKWGKTRLGVLLFGFLRSQKKDYAESRVFNNMGGHMTQGFCFPLTFQLSPKSRGWHSSSLMSPPITLEQLSTFLVLRPFNTAPHGVVTPTIKLFSSLLRNCNLATVMGCNVTPVKGPFNTQTWPTGWETLA